LGRQLKKIGTIKKTITRTFLPRIFTANLLAAPTAFTLFNKYSYQFYKKNNQEAQEKIKEIVIFQPLSVTVLHL
jgi:hypothetical protein